MDTAAQAAADLVAEWDQIVVEIKPLPPLSKSERRRAGEGGHQGRRTGSPVGRYRPLDAVVAQIAEAIREGERRGREQALAEMEDCESVAVAWDDGRQGGEAG